ncbi:ADP-ribosylglycohydrolase family protein [bacterium]|nr:ADP-ribosylglycohydrolase family protein [bacterium]
MAHEQTQLRRALAGCLLGAAVGDSVCLPREGMSARRSVRLFGHEPHQCLLPRTGLLSDDTEHLCMTAQALAGGGISDVEKFARRLAWKLRWWMAALPPGTGKATALACIRLWLGFGATRAGMWSAGNGPMMRAPVLGLAFANEPEAMRAFAVASTCMTHRDPKALDAALAIAVATRVSFQQAGEPFDWRAAFDEVAACYSEDDPDARWWLPIVRAAVEEEWDAERFLEEMKTPEGPSGYVHQTAPAVLYTWLRHPRDFRGAMHTIVALGGDADTTGAVAGAIIGAAVGKEGIPAEWLRGMRDWPRSVAWIERVAGRLATAIEDGKFVEEPLFWPAIPVRNLAMLIVVLAHGLYRLRPW